METILLGLIFVGVLVTLGVVLRGRRPTAGNIAELVQLSAEQIGREKEEIRQDASQRDAKFSEAIQDIRQELQRHRDLVQKIEKERSVQFAALDTTLKHQSQETEGLRGSADRLRQILADNRRRGRFGERIAADILKMSGLIEGTHYVQNKQLETTTTRPDVTFLLPDGYKVNMDVKFPLDNFGGMIASEEKNDDEAVARYRDAFFKDVNQKVKEVTSRDYINPEEQTLDWVILFIPNEGVASFIHEEHPDMFEIAMEKRVVFASPYQLLGLVRIIHQSYENFYFSQQIREILKLNGQLMKRLENFRSSFAQMGRSLEKAREVFQDIENNKLRLVEDTVKKIDAQTEADLET